MERLSLAEQLFKVVRGFFLMEFDLLKWNEVSMIAVLFHESLGIKMCLSSDYISCEECYKLEVQT
jgi:hypothetical protein